MAIDAQEQARTRLGELREQFAQRLRDRLTHLYEVVMAAHAEPTQGALAEAIGVAHRLAGTAGSFGHIEVGELASSLSRALVRIAGGQDDWDAALDALDRTRLAGHKSRAAARTLLP